MIPLFTVAVPKIVEVTQRWLWAEQISDNCIPNPVKKKIFSSGINKLKKKKKYIQQVSLCSHSLERTLCYNLSYDLLLQKTLNRNQLFQEHLSWNNLSSYSNVCYF